MSDDKSLKSTLFYNNNRTYLFDIKVSPKGNKYILIQENKLNVVQWKISIDQENISQFINILNQLLPELLCNEKPNEDKPSDTKPWTSLEDKELKSYFEQGVNINGLSQIFQRNKSAIRSRLSKLSSLDSKPAN